MILPSKNLSTDRALITVGARILTQLDRPKTVSAVWEALVRGEENEDSTRARRLSYSWFVLALDLLYTIGAVELERGLLRRGAA